MLLAPIMPERAREIWRQLGLPEASPTYKKPSYGYDYGRLENARMGRARLGNENAPR